MNILQCGYGQIGKSLFSDFEQMAKVYGGSVSVFDPYVENCPNKVQDLKGYYDFAFICVPTDQKSDGSADVSIVIDICNKINAEVIIIKSTIPINIQNFLPSNTIFSPEFTGVTPHKGFQNFVILGGERKLSNKVALLYKQIHSADFEIIYTDIKTAIMTKYMQNCYLALKVTFCNEIASACRNNDIEYEDVRNIFIKDSRINPSHTYVYEENPFYDSHCLNKDVAAFNAQFNLPLMKSVESINLNMKKSFKRISKNEVKNDIENYTK